MKRNWIFVLIVTLVGLVTACGAAPQAAPTATSMPVVPSPTATPADSTRDLETPEPTIEGQAVEFLANSLDIDAQQIEVVSMESVMWNDASLGCPEPGEMYAQVVTPGYRITLQANGTEYAVHTDEAGEKMVRCTDGAGDTDTRDLEQNGDTAANIDQKITTQLAAGLGVPASELTLSGKESVNWPDTSLGCPEPGKDYAQVVVPGYELVFEDTKGTTYRVHTDTSGDRWVVCRDGTPQNLNTTRGATMGATIPTDVQPAYKKALDTAQSFSGSSAEALTLRDWESVTWNDASLGCPKEGMMYAQVITPGYRFTFEANGNTIEVHTNETGSSAVVCTD